MSRIIVWIIMLAMAPAYAADATIKRTRRADGSYITYYLQSNYNYRNSSTLLVLVQGSACISIPQQTYNIDLVRSIAPDADLLWVEKYGLTHEDRQSVCPQAYIENNSPLQRVEDYRVVLNKLAIRYHKVILIGAFDGAAIVSLLVADEGIPITAGISVNSGSPSYAEEIMWRVKNNLSDDKFDESEAVLREFLELGKAGSLPHDMNVDDHGYLWWYEMLNTNICTTLSSTDRPILIIQTLDDHYLSLERMQDMHGTLNKKDNITIQYYEDVDYESMTQVNTIKMKRVLGDIHQWMGGLKS